mgnify:FL=1
MDLIPLDKNSSEQLYLQIRRSLLKAIRGQELAAGQRIPSASELAEMSNVSRMTVRQALQSLVNEGWLYTVPGKGTFVSESPRIEQNLQHLSGWTEEIRAQGKIPGTKLIRIDRIEADRTIAEKLGISQHAPVFQLVRLRLADSLPISVERPHLACSAFPELDKHLTDNVSLYQVMRDQYQSYPVKAVQYLEAGEADAISARLLEIAVGKPVLIVERITYDSLGRPLEYTPSVTKAGILRYKTEMSGLKPTYREVILRNDLAMVDGDPLP